MPMPVPAAKTAPTATPSCDTDSSHTREWTTHSCHAAARVCVCSQQPARSFLQCAVRRRAPSIAMQHCCMLLARCRRRLWRRAGRLAALCFTVSAPNIEKQKKLREGGGRKDGGVCTGPRHPAQSAECSASCWLLWLWLWWLYQRCFGWSALSGLGDPVVSGRTFKHYGVFRLQSVLVACPCCHMVHGATWLSPSVDCFKL
jgi:hypothetical protein